MTSTSAPYGSRPGDADPFDPSARARGETGSLVAALVLIALGLAFFAGNLFAVRGATLFLALGLAFLAARVATGSYGFAVPAGILLGFAAFVGLEESRVLARLPRGTEHEGAWFFLMLGLGFVAVYLIGGRFSAAWPLVPAAVLGTLGAVLAGWTLLWPLAGFAWIAPYWPLTLVLIGLWLLLRDALPGVLRTVIGAAGLLALLAYGVIAVAATVAVSGAGPGR